MLHRKILQLALVASLLSLSVPAFAQNVGSGDISIAKVEEMFKNAALNATKDTDTVVVEDQSIKVLIRLDEPKKLMTFMLIFGFEDGTPQSERIQLANKLNYEVVFARFYVSPEGMLYADYSLSYEEGIAPAMVVRAYRWIYKTVTGGIQSYDEKKIVR